MILEYLDLIMFAALMGAILLGFPVSFAIAGCCHRLSPIWAMGHGCYERIGLLGALGQRVFGVITNDVLIAIPLFVIMGVVLERSKIAEDLLDTMGRLFGQLRGGLGHFRDPRRRIAGGLDRDRWRNGDRHGVDRAAHDVANGV